MVAEGVDVPSRIGGGGVVPTNLAPTTACPAPDSTPMLRPAAVRSSSLVSSLP